MQVSTRLTLYRLSPYSTKLKTLANIHSGDLKPWLEVMKPTGWLRWTLSDPEQNKVCS